MKKIVITAYFSVFIVSFVFSQTDTRMDVSLYASTRGEMQFNFVPQWKFPILQGETPLTSDNNIALRLDASLSPIWAGLAGDAVLTVFPFLSFTVGAMTGTGWNYDLFGKVLLVGLGMNRKTNINDPNESEVIGNGVDGVVWDVHTGITLQFDLAAFFPGDWNHVLIQCYNELRYMAYTKARGDEFWYYLNDDGLNLNAFRHKFELFVGYAMPIFVDLAGVQLAGALPFYNVEAGSGVRDRGYSLDTSLIVNFKISKPFSIMTIARFTNSFIDPDTRGYDRERGFDRVQFIANWRIK